MNKLLSSNFRGFAQNRPFHIVETDYFFMHKSMINVENLIKKEEQNVRIVFKRSRALHRPYVRKT